MRWACNLALLGLVLLPEPATAQVSEIRDGWVDPSSLLLPEPATAQVSEIRDGWVDPSSLLAAVLLGESRPKRIDPARGEWPLSWQWTGALIGAVGGLIVASQTAEYVDGCIGCGLEYVVFPVVGGAAGALLGHLTWIGAGRP
jgi:hypothetical protein